MIGYDIRNEPHAYPTNGCTWGDGSDRDIKAMFERVGNAILAIDPDKLIICEGPQDYSNSFAHVGNAPWGCFFHFQLFNFNCDFVNTLLIGDLSTAGRGDAVTLNVSNKVSLYSFYSYHLHYSYFNY